MRGKKVATPFFHDCVKKMRNGTKVYKGFKAWELNLLGEFKFLLMVILIPRKKNGFDPEFAEIFKAYNEWGGCPFKGYDSKINLVSTVKKNKNEFKVLLNKYGVFIFREKMDIEIESTMNDDISTDDEATVFSGEIPSPTSRYFKYDSDIIEEVSEKIIERFVLPKLLEEIPVVSVDRITNVSDLNYDSSGYESALTSPSFENSLLSINSPVNSEGFCENDDNQVKENSLLIEIENTRNLPSFQNCPSTSSVGQLVQTSREQFSNEQAVMNVLMSELGNTGNSSSFQNLPSTSSVGQLVQTSQEQFFNEQAVMNASMPELGNTGNSSSFQNFPSTSSVKQLVQASQGHFFNEQVMMNASMPELGNASNSSSFQNLSSTSSVGQLIQTSQEQFFNKQTMINVSMPVHENTRKSSLQNLLSTSLVEKFTQNSQEQFSNEQSMINDLILAKLKMRITHAADMISISSGYGSSPVSPFSETSSTINSPINLESLSDCSLLSDFGNTLNSTSRDLPPYISLEQVQSSSEQSLDQQVLTNNFMPENDSLLDNTSIWCEELLNYKEKMNELKQHRQEARKADQPEETENYSLLDDISKWCEELLNSKEKMDELKQLHEEAQKTDQPGETENSKADEQQVISNSSPHFVECGTFESSSFDPVSSVLFNGKSDANIFEQSIDNFSEEYSEVLGVLKMEDLFQKYSSLTDIPTLKKDQRYPSCVDFSSVHFEFLEEMDTSESGLLNTSQDMDCS